MTAETAFAKYVFLDVVGFTKDRTVEAQSDIIQNMNRIIKEALSSFSIPAKKLIILPSGDGLCIALIELLHPFDMHLLIALNILERLNFYNSEQPDDKRRFQLRIGINENVDNLITDYNGQLNVAGAGISTAQFIMNQAEDNQIFVSENIYNTLKHREQYIKTFRYFNVMGKHNQSFDIYQYIHPGHTGLNTELPAFAPKPPVELVEPQFTKLVAYYLAHAIKNRDIFIAKLKDKVALINLDYAGIILLFFLARDSEKKSQSPSYHIFVSYTWSAGQSTVDEQLNYYCNIDLTISRAFSEEIISKYLINFHNCFESVSFGQYLLINDIGHAKLKNDYPDIWKECFGEESSQ